MSQRGGGGGQGGGKGGMSQRGGRGGGYEPAGGGGRGGKGGMSQWGGRGGLSQRGGGGGSVKFDLRSISLSPPSPSLTSLFLPLTPLPRGFSRPLSPPPFPLPPL